MVENCTTSMPPYQIKFSSSGEIEVVDRNQDLVGGEEVKFPIPTTEFLGLRNIVIVEAKGSHYIVVCNGTTYKKYYLPH